MTAGNARKRFPPTPQFRENLTLFLLSLNSQALYWSSK